MGREAGAETEVKTPLSNREDRCWQWSPGPCLLTVWGGVGRAVRTAFLF